MLSIVESENCIIEQMNQAYHENYRVYILGGELRLKRFIKKYVKVMGETSI